MKRASSLLFGFAILGCTALGCDRIMGSKSASPASPDPAVSLPNNGDLPVSVDVAPGPNVGLTPPQAPPERVLRSRKRMELEQLSKSLKQVTDGIGWTEMRGNTEVDLFDDLGSTLGRADYIQITQEDLEPSAMFQKFLNDAARSVCARLLDREMRAPLGQRILIVQSSPSDKIETRPERINADLQAAILRFHGRSLASDAPELESWRWLFRSAEHVSGDPVEAWRAVCIGLITHPDFYTY